MEHFPRSNPNNIGSLGKALGTETGVETSSDKVYRSVAGEDAIADLYSSGVVRNRASAEGYASKRGEQVYWTRGADGEMHALPEGSHLIEAPHEIASERAVKAHEVTAIYAKNEQGEVEDRLEQLRARLGL